MLVEIFCLFSMVADMSRDFDHRAIAAWTRYRRMLNLSALARELGISPVSVASWPVVPETRLTAVAEAVGIPAEKLRPDLPGMMPWETRGAI